jgi:superfamily II DNA/RNA helicase
MFTATYTKRLKNMAGKYIENPVVLTIGGSHTYNKNITHYFIKVRRA